MALTLFLTASFLAFGGFTLLYNMIARNRKLPPGPVGVPLLGYLPFLDVFQLGPSFKKVADKFGDIFSLRVGTQLAVVLNSEDAIREAFTNPALLARPDTFMFRFFSQGERGLASASGERWRVQRNFTHRTLKSIGFNNRERLQTHLQEEVGELIRMFESKSESGKAVRVDYDLNVSVANVLWAIVSGERKPQGDPTLKTFLSAVNKGLELATTSAVLLFMPFLIKVLPERLFRLDELRAWMKSSYAYIDETIAAHKASFVAGQAGQAAPRDFIDSFLQEMSKPDAHESFDDFQLQVLCADLFGAGGEPVSVTLKWAIYFLAKYPAVQAEAQAELDRVVGADAFVALSEKEKLPFVQALVMEVIRLADIHPIGVVHSASEDAYLDGYLVPKGTFLFPNLHALLTSPAHWERPHELHPGHWIDAEGRFSPKHAGFLSFGVGKRNCPGQELAVIELFSFIANLLQRFRFRLPAGAPELKLSAGVVVSPEPYDVILEAR